MFDQPKEVELVRPLASTEKVVNGEIRGVPEEFFQVSDVVRELKGSSEESDVCDNT